MIHQEYKQAAEKPMQSTAIMPIINRLKITLGILLTATMIFSLTACGGGSSDPENTSTGNNTTTEAGISTERYGTMEDATIEIYDPYIEIRPGADIPEEPSSQPTDDGILHLSDVFKTMEYGLSLEQVQAKYGEPDSIWEGTDSECHFWESDYASEKEIKVLRYTADFMDVSGTLEIKFQKLASNDSKAIQVYWTPYKIENYNSTYSIMEGTDAPVEDLIHLYDSQSEVDNILSDIIGIPKLSATDEYDDYSKWISHDDLLKVRDHELDHTAILELYTDIERPEVSSDYEVILTYIDTENIDGRLMERTISIGKNISMSINTALALESTWDLATTDYAGQVIAINDLLQSSDILGQELNEHLSDLSKEKPDIFGNNYNGNSIIGDSIKDLNGDSLEPYYYVQFDNDGQFTLWYGKIDDAHTINPVLGSAVWSE